MSRGLRFPSLIYSRGQYSLYICTPLVPSDWCTHTGALSFLTENNYESQIDLPPFYAMRNCEGLSRCATESQEVQKEVRDKHK